MKKLLLFTFSLFVLLLVSCSNGGNSKTQNNLIIYTDNDPIEDDNIKLEFENPSCYGYNNYSFDLYVNVTNKEYKTKTYKIKDVELIKESTSAKYTVYYDESLEIEAEMKSSLSFSSSIPSSISADNYKLTFSINSYNITYYPYETPDDLREDRKINYYIMNKSVKTDTVKDGRTIINNYVFESSDNLYYCDTWYLDSNYKTKLTSSTVIKEDTDLYGLKSSNIKFSNYTSDTYAFVSGVNHVPSNGIFILPETYANKELAMSNYAIRNINVSKIYIPKTMNTIHGGNFTGIGNATIYYEGTEAEWKALFYSQSNIVTTNVVYNTKAPK